MICSSINCCGHMNKRFRQGAIVAVATLLILSLIPRESVVVPAWSVQIVGVDSRPVEGINVRQVWQDYTLESNSHEEMVVAPRDGRVSFPERRISVPRLMLVVGIIRNVLNSGVHSSFGPSSWLIIWGKDDLEGNVSYVPGLPLPDRVTVQKRSYGH